MLPIVVIASFMLTGVLAAPHGLTTSLVSLLSVSSDFLTPVIQSLPTSATTPLPDPDSVMGSSVFSSMVNATSTLTTTYQDPATITTTCQDSATITTTYLIPASSVSSLSLIDTEASTYSGTNTWIINLSLNTTITQTATFYPNQTGDPPICPTAGCRWTAALPISLSSTSRTLTFGPSLTTHTNTVLSGHPTPSPLPGQKGTHTGTSPTGAPQLISNNCTENPIPCNAPPAGPKISPNEFEVEVKVTGGDYPGGRIFTSESSYKGNCTDGTLITGIGPSTVRMSEHCCKTCLMCKAGKLMQKLGIIVTDMMEDPQQDAEIFQGWCNSTGQERSITISKTEGIGGSTKGPASETGKWNATIATSMIKTTGTLMAPSGRPSTALTTSVLFSEISAGSGTGTEGIVTDTSVPLPPK
jgi:hypothetical protein